MKSYYLKKNNLKIIVKDVKKRKIIIIYNY